jgi:tol-pal system protein YbgF
MKRFAHPPIAGALVSAVAIFCALLLAVPAPVHAQQKPAPAQGAPAGSGPGQDRLSRIEEQLLDMQGIIGTLQSLVSGAGGAAQQGDGAAPMVPPRADSGFGGGSGDLGQRVDVIETQIRALSGQMEQITNQLSQLQASLGGGGGPAGQSVPPGAVPGAGQQGQLQLQPPAQTFTQQPAAGAQPAPPVQQTPEPRQPAPRLGAIQQAPQGRGFAPSGQPAAAPANPNTRAVYETAYNHLLQRDFASAETGFTNFLRAYPSDPLAGNAQYWLGETYYVRGKYRQAADSFLTGYRNYKNSDKAPASLLKLGMSLHQMGEKDAACATFSELSEKYPRAAQHLKQRAATESRRSGC